MVSMKLTKYQQVAVQIRADLIEELAPNDVLPTERELMSVYGVSRMTVRAALAQLAEDGAVYRIQGSGTYVTDGHAITKSTALTSFSEDISSRGMTPGSAVIAVATVPAFPEIARDLALSPGSPVISIERVRTADGVAICIERVWVPCWLVQSEEDVRNADSLYAFFESKGASPAYAEQTISAYSLSAAEAELLGVPAHTAALVVDRVAYDVRGRRVEVSRGTYRWDKYQFNVSVTRRAPGRT